MEGKFYKYDESLSFSYYGANWPETREKQLQAGRSEGAAGFMIFPCFIFSIAIYFLFYGPGA
jgi:hypothetical protein